jgi:hypothetical protein
LQANLGCHIIGGNFSFEGGKKTYFFEGGMGRISPNILVKKNHCNGDNNLSIGKCALFQLTIIGNNLDQLKDYMLPPVVCCAKVTKTVRNNWPAQSKSTFRHSFTTLSAWTDSVKITVTFGNQVCKICKCFRYFFQIK